MCVCVSLQSLEVFHLSFFVCCISSLQHIEKLAYFNFQPLLGSGHSAACVAWLKTEALPKHVDLLESQNKADEADFNVSF